MAHEHHHRGGARTTLTRAAAALRPRIVAIAAGLLAAGCGGNSPRQPTGSPTITAQARAFSQCMRRHEVSNFPDPSADGEVKIASSSGINFNSLSFQAAESACQKLAGGGGPSTYGSSVQMLGKFLAFSKCMRARGITDFPDPTTSPPPSAPGHTVSNGGAYLFIPITIDVNTPAYKSASAACRARSG